MQNFIIKSKVIDYLHEEDIRVSEKYLKKLNKIVAVILNETIFSVQMDRSGRSTALEKDLLYSVQETTEKFVNSIDEFSE